MPRPRQIIIIRHGESESNKDKFINTHTPNHLVPLTEKGREQARDSGKQLLELLQPGERHVEFYTSPYKRARETLKGIVDVIDEHNTRLGSVNTEPYDPNVRFGSAHFECESMHRSASKMSNHVLGSESSHTVLYKIKEEPRLREQDFGNYQPPAEEMSRILKDRSKYGHFFYRIPNGESAADVYDRACSFVETLFRHFESNKSDVVCLVTHGIFARIFLMKWFRWTYEEFESLKNIPNSKLVIMELDPSTNKYVLKTSLGKWKDHEEEREQFQADVYSNTQTCG